jgi:hypothetical protein
MSSPNNSVSEALSRTTPVFHLKLWVLIAIGVGIVMAVLFIVVLCLSVRRKKKTVKRYDHTSSLAEIPIVSKEIIVDRVDAQSLHDSQAPPFMPVHDNYAQIKGAGHLAESRSVDVDTFSQCSSVYNIEKAGSSYSEDYSSSGPARKGSSPYAYSASPLVGLPELSHLGWGHWFTLRDLDYATNRFAKSNVRGEGGYGVVYKGRLMNGTEIAVKKILNNV